MNRILLVDDDPRVVKLLRRALERDGYAVSDRHCGRSALSALDDESFDAIVLDVSLPEVDGLEVCRRLRSRGDTIPILMLTARGGVEDRVTGLDSGADDYLCKPFSVAELTARVRALLRRVDDASPQVLSSEGLALDLDARRVIKHEVEINLTRREFDLLAVFMRNPGRVLSRQTLIDAVWDFAFETESNIVDVYVRYLREKIDQPFGTTSIETVRGIGYRWARDKDVRPEDQRSSQAS